ncbi:winged helix-turn-helix domain-containing protein [Enterococcus sp. BWR-S5]|uniref:winged helix-turn-helix domain-containing protein n=1 Tax=Enterococcus sp. BWR-S5 TaxID=2787714 RepID=UPI0019224394|nr:winged helix-turn-helix domain-containing protein [Enterococcus sp. BWR-S5]MBL1225825.1 winged helix-turn-helix domain-containing protein [Enterococcus sp. BWR-S5]
MYNIGVNQPTDEFEHTYIENLSNSKCNLVQVDSENMDAIISDLDGVFLKEDTNQNIGKICGLIMKIKEKSNPLIWVFSEEPSPIQKIIYLQMGADGAFTKEDEPEAVNLMINNSLKRYQQDKKEEMIEQFVDKPCGIELIPHNLSVKFSGNSEEIALTRLEFQLMQLLCDNYLKGVSYQEIHEHIWQTSYKNNKYKVANLVFHLRSKLEKSGVEPMLIRTVRSKGYMLSEV